MTGEVDDLSREGVSLSHEQLPFRRRRINISVVCWANCLRCVIGLA